MKRRMCIVFFLALLTFLLAISGGAVEVNQDSYISVDNVSLSNTMEDGCGVYGCQDHTTVTILEDIVWVNLYYLDFDTNTYEPCSFLGGDNEKAPVIDYSNLQVTHQTSGAVMNIEEFAVALQNGSILGEDCHINAGGSFTVYCETAVIVLESCALNGESDVAYINIRHWESSDLVATGSLVDVMLDGQAMELSAYNIEGNNYFKLRDIAALVSGSSKEFEVAWNGEMVEMISGMAYTPVGGENETNLMADTEAVFSADGMMKDGTPIEATIYAIDGYNYIKLRDLAELFDFNVIWDSETATIVIDTTSSYTAD